MLSTRLVFLGVFSVVVLANGLDKDLDHLTPPQRDAVTKLRELLKNELTETFMLEDYWLVNFLKTQDFKVLDTLQNIKKIRREQNLNQILDEDWSDMRALFPFSHGTVDKSGKPVLYIDISQWDFASYLTSEKAFARLTQYCLLMLEESHAHVRRLRAEGRNISQFSELINIDGFSPPKHACVQCAYFYRDTSEMIAFYLPVIMEKSNFINVPYVFKMVYYFFSDDLQKFVHLHGQDQKQVEKLLLDYIDRDQWPKGVLDRFAEADNSEGSMTWNKEL